MKDDRFKLINNIKDLSYYIDEILVNYPRKEFNLKDKIDDAVNDLLKLYFYTNTIEDKLDKQKLIISYLALLDFYLEKSYKRKCISLRVLNKACSKTSEIRKMTYGWIKSGDIVGS